MAPRFSVVVIARNEAEALPRLFASLAQFRGQGGEVVVVDTGSTDTTAEVARGLGARVWEAGQRFRRALSAEQAEAINRAFVVTGEAPIVKPEDSYFDYSAGRNFAASLAENDFILAADADDVLVALDLDWMNRAIEAGTDRLNLNYIIGRGPTGAPSSSFYQTKGYDRRVCRYYGSVHEAVGGGAKPGTAPEKAVLMEHSRAIGSHANYIIGLAADALANPKNERAAHYLGRELYYSRRYQSAIRELQRHVQIGSWKTEMGESLILIGDCYGALDLLDKQAISYHQAFAFDSSRAEALIRLARFYAARDNQRAALCYAKAALEIPWTGTYYADHRADYTTSPHEICYWAYGWLGEIAAARQHILKCLEFDPGNHKYMHDLRFYFEWAKDSEVHARV